jgi:hypothetical protein
VGTFLTPRKTAATMKTAMKNRATATVMVVAIIRALL